MIFNSIFLRVNNASLTKHIQTEMVDHDDHQVEETQ